MESLPAEFWSRGVASLPVHKGTGLSWRLDEDWKLCSPRLWPTEADSGFPWGLSPKLVTVSPAGVPDLTLPDVAIPEPGTRLRSWTPAASIMEARVPCPSR